MVREGEGLGDGAEGEMASEMASDEVRDGKREGEGSDDSSPPHPSPQLGEKERHVLGRPRRSDGAAAPSAFSRFKL